MPSSPRRSALPPEPDACAEGREEPLGRESAPSPPGPAGHRPGPRERVENRLEARRTRSWHSL
jgi:hypothetical protein